VTVILQTVIEALASYIDALHPKHPQTCMNTDIHLLLNCYTLLKHGYNDELFFNIAAAMTSLTLYIEAFIRRIGLASRYLGLILVINTTLVVALRYLFNWSPIALQETMTYFHASLFMLGAAYTLQQDAHVRVDVFYQHMSERKKHLVNLFGTLFLLLPTCAFIFIICLPYVSSSVSMGEHSVEGNGLPFLYILKSLLLVLPILLSLQGVANLIRHGVALKQITSNTEGK
jgi:TRAP-type mannitol/chloroaromatic compound transport system permease small subunit